MNKRRRIPRNHDCPPFSKAEREALIKMLEHIEYLYYMPYKWLSSGYSEARVTEYDGETITVLVKYGVDGDRHFEDEETIERKTLLKPAV